LSGIVRGIVVNDVTGEPVPGAFVAIDHTGDAGGSNLERLNKQGLYVTTETDAEGHYALERVALRDDHPLYVTASGFVRYAETVSLTPQHPKRELEIRLKPGAAIIAEVQGEEGPGPVVAYVALRLTAQDGRLFLPPRGDWPAWPYRYERATDGRHEFADLGPGRFRVEAIQIENRTIVYLGAAETEVAEAETKTLRIESRPRDTKATVTVAPDPYQLKEQPITVFELGPELDPSLPQGYFVHPEDEHLGRMQANAIVLQHDLGEDASKDASSRAASFKSFEIKGLPEGRYTAAVLTVGKYPNFNSPAVYPRWTTFAVRESEPANIQIPWIEPKGPYPPDASLRSPARSDLPT